MGLPMTAPLYVSLYTDNPCGWHSYLVVRQGRKWARLVSTENADAITVSVTLLRSAKPLPLKPTRLASILRRIAREYGQDKTTAVRDALRLLKAPA